MTVVIVITGTTAEGESALTIVLPFAINQQLPCCVLDLYVEFRNMTNGRKPIGGNGLLDPPKKNNGHLALRKMWIIYTIFMIQYLKSLFLFK